jgi:hypothetical protein
MYEGGSAIQTLSWEPFLDNPSVDAAYRILKGMTSKSVCLHSLSLAPGVPRPFWYSTREVHHVFIDRSAPLVAHSLVHELLHGIVMEEGYHQLTSRFYKDVHPILQNEFQHPEIFRRMEKVFDLDMVPYWSYWDAELRDEVALMKSDTANPYFEHIHFPRLFTWFFFSNKASGLALREYRSFRPVLFRAVEMAYEEAKSIGHETARAHHQLLIMFRTHWYRFCDSHLPRDETGQRFVETIRNCPTKPLADRANDREESTLLKLLQEHGLRECE